MAEYIEKYKVVDLLIRVENDCQKYRPFSGYEEDIYRAFTKAEIVIGKLPAADVAPVVHGRWIAQDETLTRFMCSNCESKNYDGYEKYCPNCGAKMDATSGDI